MRTRARGSFAKSRNRARTWWKRKNAFQFTPRTPHRTRTTAPQGGFGDFEPANQTEMGVLAAMVSFFYLVTVYVIGARGTEMMIEQ